MKFRDASAPLSVAAHETTTRHVGALYPLLHDTGHGTPGVVVGLDLLGGCFSYDPFELYAAGILSSPNVVVFGQIGRGKSSFVKTYLHRQLAFGRSTFVVDPKGEYGPLARSVGCEPLSLRPGGSLRLNPLDLVGSSGDGIDTQRLQLLESLVGSSLTRDLVPRERTALEFALANVTQRVQVPTLPHLIEALFSPEEKSAKQVNSTRDELAEDGRDIALELRRLVHGDLKGMFDAETSSSIDLNGRVIVLDLSALYGSEALGLLMVCATSWLHGVIQRQASLHRRVILVVDEAWAILKDVAVARWLQSSWKLARAWGISNMAVLHRVSDLQAVGGEGSEQRSLAEGILLDSETRVIYAQPAGEIDSATGLLSLTKPEVELLGRLNRGTALWKVGNYSSLVRHIVGPGEHSLIDTDEAMRSL